jgi:hypothetical protein
LLGFSSENESVLSMLAMGNIDAKKKSKKKKKKKGKGRKKK